MFFQSGTIGDWFLGTKRGFVSWKNFVVGAVFFGVAMWAGSVCAVVYVDQDRSGGDGSSWEEAYKSVENAIAGSGESEEFWVAEGTYAPSDPLTPKPGSQFYGGFAGNETRLDQRDVSEHASILDGQKALNHVVFVNMLANNVRIDGFTIKDGAANSGSGWDEYGGGVFVDQQSCVIANCTVTANSSEIQGGGIFVNRAAVTIDNSEFQSNTSTHGGAVGGYESTLTVTNCEFSSNSASQNGGAIYNDQAPTAISNCSFTQNRADVQGGAVSVNLAGATVDLSQFSGNASGVGGAFAGYDSDVSITNSQFSSNTAELGQSKRGGAIWLNLQSPEIRNCTFSDNVAGSLGGAVEVNNTPQAIISDCNFIDNSAVNGGGGVSGLWDLESPEPSVTVLRCSFQGNSSGLEAGAIYSYYCHFLIQETTFISNTGVNGGAIMLDYELTRPSRVERSLFIKNSATARGGAIHCFERKIEIENSVFAFNSSPNAGAVSSNAGDVLDVIITMSNCTLYGNKAQKAGSPETEGYGGAMLNSYVSMAYLNNCIFWGNQADAELWDPEQSKKVKTPDVFNAGSSSMTTRYTDMESLDWEHGSVTEIHTGSFSSDPLFKDPDGADNIEGTLDDDFHLTLSSPCLDHADGDNAPELDIDFEARRDLVGVPNLGTGTPPYGDLGPYETQPVSFVNKNDGTCGGKVPCYTSIQGAIDAATDGTTIKIVQGDYAEAIILSTSKDLSLKAGWDSAFTTQSSTSGIQSLTISDGKMKTEYLVIR